MVSIGDVFSVVSTLFGVCFTAWALVIGATLLFQTGASRARDAYRISPWGNFAVGVLVSFVLGIASITFLKTPFPGFKLLGMGFLLTWMSMAALGAAGIVMHVSDRICALDPSCTRYNALLRASLIIVVAGIFPVLGWFLVGPVLIVASTGYACRALFSRQGHTLLVPPFPGE